MSLRLDGKVASLAIKQQLKEEFSRLNKNACLAIIHYPDGANTSYLKGRKKIAEELDVNIKVYEITENDTTDTLLKVINKFNNDASIDGIMVDRPLPKKFDESTILETISTKKDVDGYSYNNLGRLLSNKNCFVSATPQAAVRLLDFYNIDLSGKDVLVIGRSINVGKPLSLLLLNKNATVTVAHSKTKNLGEITKLADILVVAIGNPRYITADMIKDRAVVIDVGINRTEEGKLVGDVDFENVQNKASYITPVPGGVGPMTIAMLMTNVVKAAKQCNK